MGHRNGLCVAYTNMGFVRLGGSWFRPQRDTRISQENCQTRQGWRVVERADATVWRKESSLASLKFSVRHFTLFLLNDGSAHVERSIVCKHRTKHRMLLGGPAKALGILFFFSSLCSPQLRAHAVARKRCTV